MSETSRHLSQIRNRLVGREIKKVEWQVDDLGQLDGLVLRLDDGRTFAVVGVQPAGIEVSLSRETQPGNPLK